MDEEEEEVNRPINTYIIIAILAVAIVLIVGLLMVGLTIYLNNRIDQRPRITARGGTQHRSSDKKVVIPRHSIDGIAGMSYNQYKYVGNGMGIINCGEGGRSELVNGRCSCVGNYWGINCELESYNPSFNAIGNLPIEDKCEIDGYYTSFRQCHNDCLISDSCVGFEWRNNYCNLLSEIPTFDMNELPTYNPTTQPELFLKESRPLFLDVVFIYYGELPRRFWQGNRDNVIPIVPGTVYQVPFIADNWINDSKLDLAMSDVPFDDIRQAKRIQLGSDPFIPTTYNWMMIVSNYCSSPYWGGTSVDG